MDFYARYLHINDKMSALYEKTSTITNSAHFDRYTWGVSVNSSSYELQYVAEGAVALEWEGGECELDAGSLWVNLPGRQYDYRPSARYGWWNHRFVVFQGEICRDWDRLGLIPHAPVRIPRRIGVEEKLDRIIELAGKPLPLDRLDAVNRLEGLLLDISKRELREMETDEFPAGIIEEIDAKRILEPDYDEVAKRHGMTRRTFFRRFLRIVGRTPHAYHLDTKMNWAKRKLEDQLPIKEVAFQLGYADVFYFTRQFKQLTGLTPGDYQKRNRRLYKNEMPLEKPAPRVLGRYKAKVPDSFFEPLPDEELSEWEK